MARRSHALKPHINQIRAWTRQGRTDLWIAHALDSTQELVAEFRTEHGIERRDPSLQPPPITAEAVALESLPEGPLERRTVQEADDADDDADAAEAAEAAEAEAGEPDGDAPKRRSRRRRRKAEDGEDEAAATAETEAAPAEPAAEEEPARKPSSRGRRRAEPAKPAPTTPSEEPAAAEPSTRSSRNRRRRKPDDAAPAGARLGGQISPTGGVVLLAPHVLADATFRNRWGDAWLLEVEVGADAITLRRRDDA